MKTKRKKIIMLDDDVTNLTVARNALIDKYDIFTVPTAEKLFHLLSKVTPDLILLDIEMPGANGYEVIKKLKSSASTAEIPIIFLTALTDPKSESKGLGLGAVDYITKPFSYQLLLQRIDIHLLVEDQKKELKNYGSNLEAMVSEKTKTIFELQNSIMKIVAELVECRDNVTGGHIERTQNYLRLLLEIMLRHNIYAEAVSSWDSNLFVMSSLLHDVGKISIRDNILLKPDKLTKEEYEEIKKHCLAGVEIIERIERTTKENVFLQYAKVLAASHHERWDGTGYPYGLKGEEIPLQGRLMAIVDVYDALTNERPYKSGYTHEKSVEIIREELGSHFDPALGTLFLTHEQDFKIIMTDDD